MSIFFLYFSYLILNVHCQDEMESITLPCDKKQNNVFCMGAKNTTTSFAGEGCVAANDCQILVVGERIESSTSVSWQILTNVEPDRAINQYMKFALPLSKPYVLNASQDIHQNPNRVVVYKANCLSFLGSNCTGCAEGDGLGTSKLCLREGRGYEIPNDEFARVRLGKVIYRRNLFTSSEIIVQGVYRVSLTVNKVYPYAYIYDANKVIHAMTTVSSPIVVFGSQSTPPAPVPTPSNPVIPGDNATDVPPNPTTIRDGNITNVPPVMDDIVTSPTDEPDKDSPSSPPKGRIMNKYVIIAIAVVAIALLTMIVICFVRSSKNPVSYRKNRVKQSAESDGVESVAPSTGSAGTDAATMATYVPNVPKKRASVITTTTANLPSYVPDVPKKRASAVTTTTANLPSYVPSVTKKLGRKAVETDTATLATYVPNVPKKHASTVTTTTANMPSYIPN